MSRRRTPKQKAETELWELVKKYIRARDNNACQKCGKYVTGRGADTSHVLCKKTYKSLKYDEQNLKVLCMYCHKWWHNNPTDSGDWFKKKFPDRWDYLESVRNNIVKMNIIRLNELIDEYNDKLVGQDIQKGAI